MDLEFIIDSKSSVWIVNSPLIIIIDPYFVRDQKPQTLEQLLQMETLYSFRNIKPSYMKPTFKARHAFDKQHLDESNFIEMAKLLEAPEHRLVVKNGQVRNRESPL